MPVDFSKIRRLRERLGMTMDEAGRRAGHEGKRARIWWNDVESGSQPDLRVSTLERIARALECSPLDLLTGDGERPQKRGRPSGSAGSKG